MALGEDGKKGPPRLALDSAASTRKTLARLIRLRFRGELDSATFRDLFYGANTLLGYDKLLADLRIEERLDALEAALTENKKRPSRDERATSVVAPASTIAPHREAANGLDEGLGDLGPADAPMAQDVASPAEQVITEDWRNKL